MRKCGEVFQKAKLLWHRKRSERKEPEMESKLGDQEQVQSKTLEPSFSQDCEAIIRPTKLIWVEEDELLQIWTTFWPKTCSMLTQMRSSKKLKKRRNARKEM